MATELRKELEALAEQNSALLIQLINKVESMGSQMEGLSSEMRSLDTAVRSLTTTVTGTANATDGGLKQIVDRHEQQLSTISRFTWLIVGSVVASLVGAAFAVVKALP